MSLWNGDTATVPVFFREERRKIVFHIPFPPLQAKKENDNDFPNIVMVHPVDIPDAAAIKEIQSLIGANLRITIVPQSHPALCQVKARKSWRSLARVRAPWNFTRHSGCAAVCLAKGCR